MKVCSCPGCRTKVSSKFLLCGVCSEKKCRHKEPLRKREILTAKPCPRCLPMAQAGHLRVEMVQRLPAGVHAPLARDGSGACCFDCAAAEGLMQHTGLPSFIHARIAIGADRQDQYRLPGAPMGLVSVGLVRPSQPGDFEDQSAWLKRNNYFDCSE